MLAQEAELLWASASLKLRRTKGLPQFVMALHDLSPAHSSAKADCVHAVLRCGRAMNAARNQSSHTLPSQQMQLYNIHRLLVSSGRGRAARKAAALVPDEHVHQYLIALRGISFHPAVSASYRDTDASPRPRASLPKLQFCHFQCCTLDKYLLGLHLKPAHVLCLTCHGRATEINEICNRLLSYFPSHS